MVGEALRTRPVARRSPAGVANVDPLEDTGELPEPERPVIGDARDVEPGGPRVTVEELGPGAEAGQGGGGDADERRLVPRLRPVDEEQAEVGERVAQRADLPVEDGEHLAGV